MHIILRAYFAVYNYLQIATKIFHISSLNCFEFFILNSLILLQLSMVLFLCTIIVFIFKQKNTCVCLQMKKKRLQVTSASKLETWIIIYDNSFTTTHQISITFKWVYMTIASFSYNRCTQEKSFEVATQIKITALFWSPSLFEVCKN